MLLTGRLATRARDDEISPSVAAKRSSAAIIIGSGGRSRPRPMIRVLKHALDNHLRVHAGPGA